MLAADMTVFGNLDQRQIADEIAANPSFAPKLRAMLAQTDAGRLVSSSALRAVENEMRPRAYPDSRGEWVTLRKTVNALIAEVPKIVEKEVAQLSFGHKMRVVRAIAQGYEPVLAVGVDGMGDLGQFDFISSIVTSVVGAASSVYSAKVTADAQKDIAKMQTQAAMKSLETQMAIADAQQAINAAKVVQAQAEAQKAQAAAAAAGATGVTGAVSSVAQVLTKDIGGGIPLWTVPVAVGGLGLVLYFVMRKKKGGKR